MNGSVPSLPTLKNEVDGALILASVALALILISAFFFPAVLETPGLESFMVGP
jgi:hypothetical protein